MKTASDPEDSQKPTSNAPDKFKPTKSELIMDRSIKNSIHTSNYPLFVVICLCTFGILIIPRFFRIKLILDRRKNTVKFDFICLLFLER